MATGMLHRVCTPLASYSRWAFILDVERLPAFLCGGVERLGYCGSGVTMRRATRSCETEHQVTSVRCEHSGIWQLAIHDNTTRDLVNHMYHSPPIAGAFEDLHILLRRSVLCKIRSVTQCNPSISTDRISQVLGLGLVSGHL
jgi:hypothetical protein